MKWGVLLVNSGTPASLVDARRARIPRRVVRRSARGRAAAAAVVADPARHHPARASARQREEVCRDLDAAQVRRSRSRAKRCVPGSRHRCVTRGTPVALAMLYTGGATVREAIDSLRNAGASGILVIPMFPQYCGASTGAVFDQVSAALRRMRDVPALKFVSNYHDDPAYIDALAASVHDHRREFGRHPPSADVVPRRAGALRHARRSVSRSMPAHRQPAGAATRPRRRDAWSVSFQSRFGRARWLQPYTSEVLAAFPEPRREERERDLSRVSRPIVSRLSRRSAWRTATCSWRRAASSITTSRRSMRAPTTSLHCMRLVARELHSMATSRPPRSLPHALAESLSRHRCRELVRGVAVPAAPVRLSRTDTGRGPSTTTPATRASRSWSASCS